MVKLFGKHHHKDKDKLSKSVTTTNATTKGGESKEKARQSPMRQTIATPSPSKERTPASRVPSYGSGAFSAGMDDSDLTTEPIRNIVVKGPNPYATNSTGSGGKPRSALKASTAGSAAVRAAAPPPSTRQPPPPRSSAELKSAMKPPRYSSPTAPRSSSPTPTSNRNNYRASTTTSTMANQNKTTTSNRTSTDPMGSSSRRRTMGVPVDVDDLDKSEIFEVDAIPGSPSFVPRPSVSNTMAGSSNAHHTGQSARRSRPSSTIKSAARRQQSPQQSSSRQRASRTGSGGGPPPLTGMPQAPDLSLSKSKSDDTATMDNSNSNFNTDLAEPVPTEKNSAATPSPSSKSRPSSSSSKNKSPSHSSGTRREASPKRFSFSPNVLPPGGGNKDDMSLVSFENDNQSFSNLSIVSRVSVHMDAFLAEMAMADNAQLEQMAVEEMKHRKIIPQKIKKINAKINVLNEERETLVGLIEQLTELVANQEERQKRRAARKEKKRLKKERKRKKKQAQKLKADAEQRAKDKLDASAKSAKEDEDDDDEDDTDSEDDYVAKQLALARKRSSTIAKKGKESKNVVDLNPSWLFLDGDGNKTNLNDALAAKNNDPLAWEQGSQDIDDDDFSKLWADDASLVSMRKSGYFADFPDDASIASIRKSILEGDDASVASFKKRAKSLRLEQYKKALEQDAENNKKEASGHQDDMDGSKPEALTLVETLPDLEAEESKQQLPVVEPKEDTDEENSYGAPVPFLGGRRSRMAEDAGGKRFRGHFEDSETFEDMPSRGNSPSRKNSRDMNSDSESSSDSGSSRSSSGHLHEEAVIAEEPDDSLLPSSGHVLAKQLMTRLKQQEKQQEVEDLQKQLLGMQKKSSNADLQGMDNSDSIHLIDYSKRSALTNDEVAEMKKQLEDGQAELEKMREERNRHEAKVKELMEILNSQFDDIDEVEDSEQGEVKSADAQAEGEENADNAGEQQDDDEMSKKIASATRKRTRMQKILTEKVNECAELTTTVEELRDEVMKKQKQIEDLESERAQREQMMDSWNNDASLRTISMSDEPINLAEQQNLSDQPLNLAEQQNKVEPATAALAGAAVGSAGAMALKRMSGDFSPDQVEHQLLLKSAECIDLQEQIAKLNEQLDEKEEKYQEVHRDLFTANLALGVEVDRKAQAQEALDEKCQEYEALQRTNQELLDNISRIEDRCEALSDELTSRANVEDVIQQKYNDDLEVYKSSIEEKDAELEELLAEKGELQRRVRNLEMQFDELQDVGNANDQIVNNMKQLLRNESDMKDVLQSKVTVMEREKESLLEELEKLKQENEVNKALIKQNDSDFINNGREAASIQEEVSRLIDQNTELAKELRAAKDAEKALLSERERLVANATNMSITLADSRAKCDFLQMQLEEAKNETLARSEHGMSHQLNHSNHGPAGSSSGPGSSQGFGIRGMLSRGNSSNNMQAMATNNSMDGSERSNRFRSFLQNRGINK